MTFWLVVDMLQCMGFIAFFKHAYLLKKQKLQLSNFKKTTKKQAKKRTPFPATVSMGKALDVKLCLCF